MGRLFVLALCVGVLVLGMSPVAHAGEPPAVPKAKLGLEDVIAGLEKSEKAWRSLKSWMLRYEHARDAINFSLPVVYRPHDVVNARKGNWLYASWTPVAGGDKAQGYYNDSRLWLLWKDGKYTERIYDGVSTRVKDELLKAGSSSFLYQVWWYPTELGVDIVSDAFPFQPEYKEGPPSHLLARYLKSNKEKFRVRKTLDLVDKVPCHVVEWPDREVFWIDAEKGMSVRRRTVLGRRGDSLAHEFKAFEIRERSPGIWLPDRQVTVTFTGRIGEKESKVERLITSTLKEARFNDLPDDFFKVPLPEPVRVKGKAGNKEK
jgi:hypothetical protein